MSFEEKIKKFNSFYLWLLIAVGALSAAAVISAVYIKVYVGIIIGICAAVAYTAALNNELRLSLGLGYKRVEGGIALTLVEPKKDKNGGSSDRYLPSRLMWLDVVALARPEKECSADREAETLFIPSSVKRIEGGALSGMTSLRRIVFLGSPEEWCEIEKGEELCEYELSFGNGEDNYNLQGDKENEIS